MKSILLTTTALVAFAGAAAADGHTSISFTATAKLGFNDDSGFGEDGFYWLGDLGVTMSAALDNGLTANAEFGIEVVDEGDANGNSNVNATPVNDYYLRADSWVLSLEAESGALFFGDTSYAAETHWKSAGDMEADGFSEADGEQNLRADFSAGGVDGSVSYNVGLFNNSPNDSIDGFTANQLSVGVSGEFGAFTFAAAYQEEADADISAANGDFKPEEIYGVSAGGTFAGATVTVAYAENTGTEETSAGVKVAYPFGPVTATGYFVAETASDAAVTLDDTEEDPNFGINVAYADGPIAVTADYQDDQTVSKWKLEGSYDVGNGLMLQAGALNENEGDDTDFYVAGLYDLGGGAEILVVYADDADGDQEDEIGADEYMPGTTVELSFAF